MIQNDTEGIDAKRRREGQEERRRERERRSV
jgi:hypothetical protein